MISSTNKTDSHDITEILLKVALNTITLTHVLSLCWNSTKDIIISSTATCSRHDIAEKYSSFSVNNYHSAPSCWFLFLLCRRLKCTLLLGYILRHIWRSNYIWKKKKKHLTKSKGVSWFFVSKYFFPFKVVNLVIRI